MFSVSRILIQKTKHIFLAYSLVGLLSLASMMQFFFSPPRVGHLAPIALLCAMLGSSAPAADAAADRAKELEKRVEQETQRSKELEKLVEDTGIYLETAKTGVKLGGWVNASYSYNLNGGATDSGLNGTPITTPVDIEDSNDFSVNSVRIILEKALPEENTWAAGFRVDMVFGEDQKWGFDNDPGIGDGSGPMSLEFAYVTFRAPVGNGLDFQVGKWMALLGYEYTDRALNDNFSSGLLAWFLEPATHTGILMTYPVNDRLTVNFGIANGWNNSDSDFLDNNENGDDAPSDWAKLVTGSVNLTNPGENASLTLGAAYSFEGEGYFGNVSNGTIDGSDTASENAGILALNVNGTWQPVFAKGKLQLAFNADLVKATDNLHRTAGDPAFDQDQNAATAWGIGLYAKYQLTDVLYLASRAEYMHADDGTLGFADGLVFDGPSASIDRNEVYVSNTDLWSYTLTAGLDLCDSMRLRLEYRLDAVSSDGGHDGEANLFDNNQSTQHSFSIDASYMFW